MINGGEVVAKQIIMMKDRLKKTNPKRISFGKFIPIMRWQGLKST